MTPAELLAAHRALWREAFSLKYSLLRVLRALRQLKTGAFLMVLFMNAFYCWKALWGNEPIHFEDATPYADIHEQVRDRMHVPSISDLLTLRPRKGAKSEVPPPKV